MKIIVDKLPEHPRYCLFSMRDVKCGYICQLRPYIPEAEGKPRCLCKNVEKCECLMEPRDYE